jgi:hypothetical protein
MRKALIAVAAAALTLGVAGPAFAVLDTVQVHREDVSTNGEEKLYSDTWITRDNNNTSGTGDDKFDFGGNILVRDVYIDTQWYHWVNGVWKVDDLTGDMTNVEWQIQVLTAVGGSTYEVRFTDTINGPTSNIYLPATNIGNGLKPRLKLIVRYDHHPNRVTYSAYYPAWQ